MLRLESASEAPVADDAPVPQADVDVGKVEAPTEGAVDKALGKVGLHPREGVLGKVLDKAGLHRAK